MADDPRIAPIDRPAGFRRRPAADLARLVLRGRQAALLAACAALGTPAPAALRAQQNGPASVLWLGPDEVLILVPEFMEPSVTGTLDRALQGLAHSLVAVGDRQLGFELSGRAVERVLNAGCPLDLHGSAFAVGMCTRTLLGKAEILLWRTGAQQFHLEVWRSFAPYVEDFLDQAGLDG